MGIMGRIEGVNIQSMIYCIQVLDYWMCYISIIHWMTEKRPPEENNLSQDLSIIYKIRWCGILNHTLRIRALSFGKVRISGCMNFQICGGTDFQRYGLSEVRITAGTDFRGYEF